MFVEAIYQHHLKNASFEERIALTSRSFIKKLNLVVGRRNSSRALIWILGTNRLLRSGSRDESILL